MGRLLGILLLALAGVFIYRSFTAEPKQDAAHVAQVGDIRLGPALDPANPGAPAEAAEPGCSGTPCLPRSMDTAGLHLLRAS